MKMLNLSMSLVLLGCGMAYAADRIDVTFNNKTSYNNDALVLTAQIMRQGSNVVLFSKEFLGADFLKKDFSPLHGWQEAKELLEITNVPLAITMSVSFDVKKVPSFEGKTSADLKNPAAAAMCKKWSKAPRANIFSGIYDRFNCTESYASKPFTVVYDPKKNQLYMYTLHIIGDAKDGLQLQEVDALN